MPSDQRKKTLATAAMRAAANLRNNPQHDAYQYLTETRGLTPETLAKFQLGLIPDGDQEFGDHAGWIAIPYLTPTGFVDMRFRNPDPGGKPKYKSLPGAGLRMFNPSAILAAHDTLVVAEGEMDTMILSQIGLHAIGVPGASAWSKPFELAIHGFEHIIICEDGDDSGAGKGLTSTIVKGLDWAKTVRFEGTDVNDYYLAHGAAALREKVLAPTRPPVDETTEEPDEYDY